VTERSVELYATQKVFGRDVGGRGIEKKDLLEINRGLAYIVETRGGLV